MIRIYPDAWHPGSLWPSRDLILAWTSRFQHDFVEEVDGFATRPRWRVGADPIGWYDEGYEIVDALRARFPDVWIRPGFAQYVFSVNERREGLGFAPISLPGEAKAGFVDIRELVRRRASESADE